MLFKMEWKFSFLFNLRNQFLTVWQKMVCYVSLFLGAGTILFYQHFFVSKIEQKIVGSIKPTERERERKRERKKKSSIRNRRSLTLGLLLGGKRDGRRRY